MALFFSDLRRLLGLRLLMTMALCVTVAACGFHLKGATPLPFKTIYTNINLDTEFGARLQRAVVSNSPETRFTSRRTDADVYLYQISDQQNLRQVSLDAEGRVEEYELTLTFVFQVLDHENHLILPPTTLRSVRELPYNDRIVQAKDSEITRVFSNMRNGLIDRILRRLSAPDVANAYANASTKPVSDQQLSDAPVSQSSASPLTSPASRGTYP